MEFLSYIEANWQAFVAAPLVFIGSMLIGGFAGYRLAKSHYSGVIEGKGAVVEAARERLSAAQEELARVRSSEGQVRQEVGYLIGRLTAHGEELRSVQQQLNSLPKIIVSDRPPGPGDTAPDGTLWITTGSESPQDQPLGS